MPSGPFAHVCILVKDLDKAVTDWTKILGVLDPGQLKEPLVRYDTFSSGADVGMKWATFVSEHGAEIQFIQPGEGTPLAKRLEKLGERVTLDDGESLARSLFPKVTRHDFVAELRVPSPDPIADYLRSMPGTSHHAVPERLIDTVAASHDLDPYINTLRRDGSIVLLGVPPTPHPSPSVGGLLGKRRSIGASAIGGIAETQEMLDFCAEHNVVSDVEMIRMDQIDEAYDRMLSSDVKYRFVIDMASMPAAVAS